jgi:pimeloyl-ACP methyl ester carboxylesterase
MAPHRTAAAGCRLRAALAVAVLVALAAPAGAAAAWAPCGSGSGARCTTVRVPLDRTGALPGTIPLRVARMPSAAGRPTLVYLSGGPGGAGLGELEGVLWSIPSLGARYRVVTFDQRGTGRSGLLRCAEIERDSRMRAAAVGAACARRLGPARSHYTTADSVEDLEAIRVALGLERLTLFGISYGTDLALSYARAHPDRVERLALDSVVDPDEADPFRLAGVRAMGPSLAALCPAGCRGVSEDPGADLARLAARLRAAPLRAPVYDRRGRSRVRRLAPVTISDLLYDSDYIPALRAGVPAAVRAALAGDAAPLLRLASAARPFSVLPDPRFFSGARYATLCEETPLAWSAATPLDGRPAEARRRADALGPAAFLPFDFATVKADVIDLCLRWPGVPRPRPGHGTAYPAVPALVLSGGEDLRTPAEASARVAAALPRAERVLVPGGGHAVSTSDVSGCAAERLLTFLGGGTAGGDCRRVPTRVPAIAVPPVRLAGVAPLAGLRSPGGGRLPDRVARTAAAIGLTLDDVRFAVSPALPTWSGGGLRGGAFQVGRRGLVLRGYAAVTGVRLTGGRHGRGLELRVSGPAAAAGRVIVTASGALSGTLGGRRIAGRLPHAPPRPAPVGATARASRAAGEVVVRKPGGAPVRPWPVRHVRAPLASLASLR